METELTIVVPVHNREDVVVSTLDSIAASPCKAFRLIVVDNASTDSSYVVCQQWQEEHRRAGMNVELLREATPGASAARNRGLSACETSWVYFFDSDDLFDARFVELFCSMLPADDVDMFCLPTRQEVSGCVRTRAYVATADPSAHIVNSMLSTQAMVFRASWLRGIGGWDVQLGLWDDWELGLRCLLARPRLRWLTDEGLHIIRVHPDSMTGSSFSATLDGVAAAMRAGLHDVISSTALTAVERRRLREALFYRAAIMAGKFAGEGSAPGRSMLLEIARQCLGRPTRRQSAMAFCLQQYTAHGGRGAWRLAWWLVR